MILLFWPCFFWYLGPCLVKVVKSMYLCFNDHVVSSFLLIPALLLMAITCFSFDRSCFSLPVLYGFSLCFCLLHFMLVVCLVQRITCPPFWTFLWSMPATAALSTSCVILPWLVLQQRKLAPLLCPPLGILVVCITCICESSINGVIHAFVTAHNHLTPPALSLCII